MSAVLPVAVLALGLAVGSPLALAQEAPTPHVVTLGDLNSPYNREVLWMSIPAIVLSILIFIGVTGALFYSVAKFRERPGDGREAAQFHGNNTLEIILIAVPLLIVTILTVLTARTMARTGGTGLNNGAFSGQLDPSGRNAEATGTPFTQAAPGQPAQGQTENGRQAGERIQIYGAQFWWNYEYPERGGIRNGNEMVAPVGQSVTLEITARDVMHAWWAPNLGGQRTAIPGVVKTWTISTNQPGVYQGNCSLLCGASHANMRFKAIMLPQDQYNRFVEAARAFKAPTPAAGSPAERGYEIFANGSEGQPACGNCHRVQGTPFNGAAGPDLSYFGSRYTLGAGMWEGDAAREILGEWLKNSPGVKPGSLMPAYPKLSNADVTALIAYLDTLKLPDDAAYWNWETKKFSVPVR